MDEKLPLQIEDPYGLSKQVDEATALMMPRRHGLTLVANDKRFVTSWNTSGGGDLAEYAVVA